MPQTTIQKLGAIRQGSGKLEIGDSFSALTDVGAIRDLKFAHKVENYQIPFDNVAKIEGFKSGQKGSFEFLLMEVDLTTLSVIDDGLSILTNIAGTPVAGATQSLTSGEWSAEKFIAFANQNGDKSKPSVNSVTGSVDGALTEGDDFIITESAEGSGIWGLVFRDPADATNLTTISQDITIDYDYTPNQSKKLTFNDIGLKTTKVARLTNTDSSGKTVIIELDKITNIKPLSLPFPSDDDDDAMAVEVELEGTVLSIADEQSTT